jgi:hypothetical protein
MHRCRLMRSWYHARVEVRMYRLIAARYESLITPIDVSSSTAKIAVSL